MFLSKAESLSPLSSVIVNPHPLHTFLHHCVCGGGGGDTVTRYLPTELLPEGAGKAEQEYPL